MGELIAEVGPLVAGGRVREAAALPPRDLMLVLESDDWPQVRRLRLSTTPDGPRMHLQQGRVQRHKGAVGPFFERVAKELEGATVRSVQQVRSDRLVLVGFDTDSGRRGLLAELVGRHANLLLVDGSERVLDLLVPPKPPKAKGSEPARTPRLALGEVYEPPPGRPPAEPGPPLVESFDAPAEPARDPSFAPLSFLVEAAVGGAALEDERNRAAKHLRDRLTRRLQGAEGALRGLESRERAAEQSERVRQDGELLKAALGQLERGRESIELDDWFGDPGAKRTIVLDPRRSPHQNVERLFDRYHKLVRSAESLVEERARNEERRANVLEILAALEAGGDPAELETRAVAAGLVDALDRERGKRVQKVAPRTCYRRFESAAGTEILVGRSARDNDELTLKVARGNDLWLHTADTPGSHVVLRVERGREPADEDVLDAAHLAVHFSPLKNAARADVHVAFRKQIHKRKGAPAGLVNLSGGRTRSVRMEPERLKRLLGGDAHRGGAGAGRGR
ncbi:NFACT RNA binding domain-containing protein [Rohdeia mirabilis]